MSRDSKTSFDLEPNPFEKSFANDPNEITNNVIKHENEDKNSHGLHIPLSNINSVPNKLPGITPPLLTPGGRRLPPISYSPGTVPTPGGTLWNSLLNATNERNGHNQSNQISQPHHFTNTNQPTSQTANNVNLMTANNHGTDPKNNNHSLDNNNTNNNDNEHNEHNNNANDRTNDNNQTNPHSQNNQDYFSNRKTGLTSNESNMRTGLTPGAQGFPFNHQLGSLTPGILNSPMTPGLSSLLGITSSSMLTPQLQQQLAHQPPQIQHQVQQQVQQLAAQNQHQPPQQVQQQVQEHVQQQMQNQHQAQVPGQNQDHNQSVQHQQHPQSLKEENKENEKKRKNSSNAPKKTPKSKRQKSKATDDTSDNDGDGQDNSSTPNDQKLTENEKRQQFLERNRVAASKCRKRKKEKTAKMENELEFYSSGYRELSQQIKQLRDQLIMVQGIFSNHKACNLLAQQVGGMNQLNNIIQHTNYLITFTEKSANNNSIPSTVPTTLNNIIQPIPNYSNVQIDPHAQGSGATSTTSIPNGYDTIPGSANISAHPSTTDLRSAATMPGSNRIPQMNNQNQNQVNNQMTNHNNPNTHPNPPNEQHQPQASDIRAIHSMTNLASINPNLQIQDMNDDTFNLRAVNSMVDLHNHGNLVG